MYKKVLRNVLIWCILILGIASSCSTTRVLTEDQLRLKSNVVEVTNSKDYPDYKGQSNIGNYVRQKANTYFIKTKKGGWNPFLYVYNWANGKDKGWDKFVKKLGQEPVIFDPSMVEDSKENIENHLRFLGFYNSKVNDSIQIKNKNAVVFYNVKLGKRYPIHKISYEILDPNIREDILKDTVNSLVKKGMPLSEELLDKESARSAAYLKNMGYYEFTKNYYFFAADTVSVKDSAILKISVKNYTRNESSEESRPHRKFYFGNVNIFPVSDNVKYRVSVSEKIPQILDTLQYNEITILYDKQRKIRPSVLYKMNRVTPGMVYSEDVVNNTYQRFANMRLYNSVSVELNKVDTNIVDCFIRLIPSKTHGYQVNLEASTNASGLIGISPEISYYNRNIFKGGEWLSLSVMGNFQVSVKNETRAIEFGANAGLSFPTFLLLPSSVFRNIIPRTDINLTYNYQQRPEYSRNMIGGKFGWSWGSKNNKWYFQATPLQINIVNLPYYSPQFMESLTNPFVREAYKNHFDLGLGYNMQYSSTPSINPKVSYLKASLQVDISGNLISAFNKFMPKDSTGAYTIWDSPYSQYIRAEGSASYTWMFGKDNKQALAVRGLIGAGFAYGNSSKMPFERLFWGGGPNSLRGWSGRSIGPGSAPMDTTFSIPNQTGDMRLEANIEYRFPLFSVFRGAIFFDWGNVWNLQKEKESTPGENDYTTFTFKNMFKTSSLSTGLGLRLDINFVVVRFDWGIKLYDPTTFQWRGVEQWFKRGGFAFQFGIGYPF